MRMGRSPRSICLLFCFLALEISWGVYTQGVNVGEHVHRECGFTRYPNLCTESLSGLGLGLGHDPYDILHALVEKTRDETKMSTSILPNPTDHQVGLTSQQTHVPIGYCNDLMDMSLARLNQSISALKDSTPKNKQDIQTWLSAVMTFQQACKDSVNGLSDDFSRQISGKMDHLSKLVSNSLALVNRINGQMENSTARHLTSNEEFPTWVSPKDRKLLQSPAVGPAIRANVIVAQDGTGNFEKVADAIEAAHGGRFVIYVKAGVYKEKIHMKKDGITLIGDGRYSTIISGGDSVGGGSTMPGSATFAVFGDGFIARDIGFQNTAGPKGAQALAMMISSDRSVFYRCSITGYQDTLYALALRQFYRECDIAGTIDFIFGNAAALFQNCNLILRRPQNSAYNVILANGRTDPGQNTGFSLQNCKIMAGRDLSPVKHSIQSFLGRPWKEYSRAVIMQSSVDDVISSKGWDVWEGSFALKTLYFAEYLNAGPGAGTSGRVKWSGYHLIGTDDAVKFTVSNFIGGNSWLPSTGITFNLGL
ncbi:pectinesterase-like [Magnolia sinica]|uniref:pectinesterase-like n=1 Tax=Magnolia sinica TaxID=86752 RepID=UPI00265A90D5|nr:pectinesterase-like [Magnolia sinica]